MASFSTSLEQALRRALQYANERSHEYATLEHLLLSLIDDRDAAAVMRACDVDLDVLRDKLDGYIDNELVGPGARHAWRRPADRGLPARDPSRRGACAVERPRGGDGRECAGRDLRRAREPCRLLPARAAHDPLRRGQLYQPRHRQAGRACRSRARCAASTRTQRRSRAARTKKRGADALEVYCINLNQKARAGRIDPLIGRGPEIQRTIQVLCRRQKNNPLFVGDPGVGKTAIAEGLARRIVMGDVPEVLADSHHLPARHGRAARRHPLSRRFRGAAQGRDARRSRTIPAPSCSSTRSTR